MKKVLLIHGFGNSPLDYWFPEEIEILKSKGYRVEAPFMPDTLLPERDKWVKVISDLKPNKNTVLIGHSLGCPAILRYLEKANKKVGTVILVAAFAKDLGVDFVPVLNFVKKPFDWKRIKENAEKIVVINQKDDPFVPEECGIEVSKKTGTKYISVRGDDHFHEMDLSLINDNL